MDGFFTVLNMLVLKLDEDFWSNFILSIIHLWRRRCQWNNLYMSMLFKVSHDTFIDKCYMHFHGATCLMHPCLLLQLYQAAQN